MRLVESEKTCIDETVMEMKTEQWGSHAMLFGNCTDNWGSDDGEGLGTRWFI